MKRGVFDTIKRGFDNTLANWPLILLRLAELVILGVIIVGAALLVIIPVAVSFGLNLADLGAPDGMDEVVAVLLSKWLLLVYILAVVLAVLVVATAVHAFMEAGSARVYVDAERVAGPEMAGGRQRFRVFSFDRWFTGGREGWWPAFWIYNATYGVAAAILLIPLLPTLIFMLLFRGEAAPMAITGCVGLGLTFLLMIPVGIVASIWTNRAIATWAAHRSGVRETLSAAWAEVKSDLGRHLLVAIVLMVISFAVSGVFSSFGLFAMLGEMAGENSAPTLLFTMPLRFLGSVLSTCASAAISAWFLACFTALATERR